MIQSHHYSELYKRGYTTRALMRSDHAV